MMILVVSEGGDCQDCVTREQREYSTHIYSHRGAICVGIRATFWDFLTDSLDNMFVVIRSVGC